ncbi:ISNCY family transposase [Geosporobacter subterraneus]|nr:ISNCY family transposase [Geosporobacter subterraneus]
MLILDYPEWNQPTVAQVLIPKAAYQLTPELEKIDKLLQDESFEEPIVKQFNTQRGRPTVPVRVYIRMMFLKYYAGLSYEDLVPEVTHNLMYRFFCRIPIEQKVPDATALMKITTKYSEEVINEMNQRLLKSLVQKKLFKGRKTRIDTTVVEANIVHPTDAGLLYEGVKKLTKAVTRIKQAYGKASRQSTKSIRKMKDHILSINKVLRRRTDDTRKEVRKITGQMAIEARKVLAQADRLAKKLIPETEKDRKLRGNLLDTAKKVCKIIEQSEAVNAGNTKLADRLVSLNDPDARPIVKGKLGKRVEFGYKLQIQETEGGIVTGYQLYKGNPCDRILVDDALQKHKDLFGKAPVEMALDRGYYDSDNEKLAYGAGVKHVCIPKIGRKSKERTEFENTPTFRRLKRWRSGIEGRISCLKRRFGLNRSMLSGYRKTQTWTGLGILAHNLRQAAKLMA